MSYTNLWVEKMSLWNSLVLCPFRKIMVVSSPMGEMSSLIMVLGQVYSTRYVFPSTQQVAV